MSDNFRRFLLYFRPTETYFRLVPPDMRRSAEPGPTGTYPIAFDSLLNTPLFDKFDSQGLPLRYDPTSRKYYYLYSKLFTWGLGHWQRYVATNDATHLSQLLNVLDYVRKTAQLEDGSILLRREIIGSGHVGPISAMDQGVAMSLFCKAWWATKTTKYLDQAYGCLGAFERDVDHEGIIGRIPQLGIPWYEEDTSRPLRHILNGMVFAVWGLYDLWKSTGDEAVHRAFETGINSIERALPSFDAGFWSLYYLADKGRNYLASMKYHNTHIVQLRALETQTGNSVLGEYSRRFSSYAANPVFRVGAMFEMMRVKLISLLKRGTIE
jgi:hypothetical protein